MSVFPPDRPDEQDGLDSAGGESVALLDPVEELADFRPVIVSPADILTKCTPEQQESLSGLVDLAEQLQRLTRWTRDELLDKIGCKNRDPEQLANDAAKIKRCKSFLQLILDAAQRVETVPDHRAVVTRCAHLSQVAGQDAAGVRAILEKGDVSPLDYLGLGELSTALRTARINAGIDQPGSAIGPSPYDTAPVVHLSVPRVDLYVRGRRDVLGEQTFKNITEHIADCGACHDAVKVRRTLVDPG